MSAKDVLAVLAPAARARTSRYVAEGDSVAVALAGLQFVGTVLFVEDGWVYWEEPNRRVHATPERFIGRER